jgi:hypothetical protein
MQHREKTNVCPEHNNKHIHRPWGVLQSQSRWHMQLLACSKWLNSARMKLPAINGVYTHTQLFWEASTCSLRNQRARIVTEFSRTRKELGRRWARSISFLLLTRPLHTEPVRRPPSSQLSNSRNITFTSSLCSARSSRVQLRISSAMLWKLTNKTRRMLLRTVCGLQILLETFT